MADYEAVLFDWMLTLAHYPNQREHVALALSELGRANDEATVAPLAAAIDAARLLPDVQTAAAIEDTSARAHHIAEHLVYDRAGIDDELADALYGMLGRPDFHRPYPDGPAVLARLKERGLKIAVVSDIHVDLRPHAVEFGIADHIDAWALSFELGIQKPDHRIFSAAIDGLGVDPGRSVMVGDRASRDGAAAELGLTCLILPPQHFVGPRGLDRVLDLVGRA